jgi:hypothetical protein
LASVATKAFSTITLSEDLHRMVRAVEQAAIVVAMARPEDMPEAYGCLSYSRKFLYEYLEDLERLAEVEPPGGLTHLRFT